MLRRQFGPAAQKIFNDARTIATVRLLACWIMMATTLATAARAELDWMFAQARLPVLRGMAQFAAEELVIPKGLYKDTLVNWDVPAVRAADAR